MSSLKKYSPSSQLNDLLFGDSSRNSCVICLCLGSPSADSDGNGMKPGPMGGANTAPKPPSMSPRLYAFTFSYPVIECSAMLPQSQRRRALAPDVSMFCSLRPSIE